MAIISGNLANLYDARIKKAVYQNLAMYPEEYTQWCDSKTSQNQYERLALYGEMAMPPVLGEYEEAAEAVFKPGPMRQWTHVKYGYKVIASKESIADALFPVIEQTAGSVGKAMRYRIEYEGALDLINSFTTSTVGASDTANETLCATSHATFTGAGGSAQANRPSTDITLGVDSLWAGIDNFAGLKDREGNQVMLIPRKLIIHAANKRTAIELLQSTDAPYKTTRELNALRMEGLTFTVGHFLTATAAWWVITEGKPITYYMRQPVEVETENTITNQSRTWVVTCRLSHAPYDWYQIYGTDGVA